MLESLPGWQTSTSNRDFVRRVQFACEAKTMVHFNRFKLMLVGSGGAGKTTTLKALLGHKFDRSYKPTLVCDAEKHIKITPTNVPDWKEATPKNGEHLLLNDLQNVVSGINLPNAPQLDLLTEEVEGLSDAPKRLNHKNSLMEVITRAAQPTKAVKIKKSLKRRSWKFKNHAAVSVNHQPAQHNPELSKIIKVSAWDFAGQKVFEATHQLFMTLNGVYLVVFDLEKFQNLLLQKEHRLEVGSTQQ